MNPSDDLPEAAPRAAEPVAPDVVVPPDMAAPPRTATGLPLIDHAPVEPVIERPAGSRQSRGRSAPASVQADKPVAPRRGGTPWLSLLLFLILAGGLYWVWTNPQSAEGDATALDSVQHQLQAASQTQNQLQQQVQALTPQLQGLFDRVDKLEKQAAATPAPPPPEASPAPPPAADATPPAPPVAGPSPEVADLGRKVDDLSQRLEALAARPVPASAPATAATPSFVAPAQPQDPALAQLPQQVAVQQQLVASLQTRLDQAEAAARAAREQLATEQKTSIAALAGRVGKLELGVGNVEGAAEQAGRLSVIQAATVHLQAGEKLGDLPGAPQALARFAHVEPPTEAGLREAFPAVAEHAREVSRPDNANQPFFTRLFARVQQSVTVRQGDDVIVGDPAAGVLTRAENAMLNGNLPGAVAALQRLRGPAAGAVHDWLDQAQALLAARAALVGMLAQPAAPGTSIAPVKP